MKRTIVFLTLEKYSFIALSNAIEPLRAANRVAGRQVYEWVIASMDGTDTIASNGLKISPTVNIDVIDDAAVVFVCGGLDIEKAVTPALLAKLRRLDENRIPLGSLCTGAYSLAVAGLLNNCEAVVHWEQKGAMTENFPKIRFLDRLFLVDRNRYTCTGGTAPLHMMLKIIGEQLGRIVASKISDMFVLDRIRDEEDRQYVPLAAHVGHYHENVIEAAALMESNLEDPLGMQEIARLVGVSRRQIERLFKRYVGEVPTKYYLELRLLRARSLLLDTSMTVMQVAVACGFQSGPHFSKCYRERFGNKPSEERYRRSISKLSSKPMHMIEKVSFASLMG